MPRKPGPLPLSRREVLLLVKEQFERVAAGLTKQELLDAIGPGRTSLQTIQRVLDELRDEYGAQLTCGAVDRRWRLAAPIAMPLEAPDLEDLLAVIMAQALIERFADASLREHMMKLVEQIDERVRARMSAAALPARKTMTSSVTLSARIDPAILRGLIAACRREPLRIRYSSPWQPATDSTAWHMIEPWALHMHDGAIYLRAWANGLKAPRTYSVAHIEAVERVDEPEGRTTPRRAIPTDVWGDEAPAYGIDHDRPGVAVIRMRGGVARWVARMIWHPHEQDTWLEPGELLERTFAYRSCRELARRLAMVIDGIVSIEPAELREEVLGLFRKSPALNQEPMLKS